VPFLFSEVSGKDSMTFRDNTRRQKVNELLLTGLSLKEIALKLDISNGAVKCHAVRIYHFNGVHDRIQLMAKVIKETQ
jgi:DNA-binding NarL/FixJ family response regulator